MAVDIGRAEGSVDLNYSKFKKGIQEAKKTVLEMGRDTVKAGQQMSKAFTSSSKDANQYENKLSSLAKEHIKYSNEVNKLKKSQEKYSNEVEKLKKKQEDLNGKIEKSTRDQELYRMKISNTKETLDRYKKELSETGKNKEKLNEKISKGEIELKKYDNQLKDNAQKQSVWQKELNKTEKELKQYEKSLEKVGKELKDTDKKLEEATKEYKQYKEQLKDVEKAQDKVGDSADELGESISKASSETEGSFKGIADAISNMSLDSIKGFDGIGSAVMKLPGKFNVVTGVVLAGAKIIQGGFKLGIMASKEFAGDLMTVGKVGTVAGTALAGGIALASKEGIAFEDTMYQVKAITGANDQEFKQLTTTARDWGSKTRYSATEVAEAMTYMGMAGWNTTQIIDGMGSVLNLATVGSLDLGRASDIVTDGLTAMGLTAKDSNDFADMLSATITNANTSVEMFGETMKYVGPVAGSLGIEMEDLSVAIGLMGNSGIKASQAGTALRAGLTNLVKPTDQMQATMDKYNIEVQKNADGTVNLDKTVTHLREKLGGLEASTQAQAIATIFGKEAMSGWSAIINSNEQDLQKLKSSINNSTQSMQFWKKSMEDAGMSAEEVDKNLQTLDSIFEECKLTSDSLGLATTDLGLAITLLGKDSKVTSDDVNKLLDSILKMNDPTKEAQEAMDKYGVSIERNEDRSINFSGTLDNLREVLKGKNEEQQKAILANMGLEGSTNEIIEVLKLSDSEYNNLKKNLEETKGLTSKLAETMDATTMGAIKSMSSAISDVLIEAFNAIKPHIQEFSKLVAESANMIKTDGLDKAINHMIDGIRAKIPELPQIISNGIQQMTDIISNCFGNFLDLGSDLISSLLEGIYRNIDKIEEIAGDIISNLAHFISTNASRVADGAIAILDSLMEAFRNNQEAIEEAVTAFVSSAVEYFIEKKKDMLKVGKALAGAFLKGVWEGLKSYKGQMFGDVFSGSEPEAEDKGRLSGAKFIDSATGKILDGKPGFVDTWKGILSGAPIDEIQLIAGNQAEVYVNGHKQKISSLTPEVQQTVKHMLKGQEQDARVEGEKEGNAKAEGQKQGIEQGKPTVEQKSKENVKAKDLEAKTEGRKEGKAKTDGQVEGLNQGKPQVDATVSNNIKSATNKGSQDGRAGGKQMGDNVTKGANEGMSQLSPTMAKELTKATKELQKSATVMYNGAKTSFSKLNQVAKTQMSEMYRGVSTSFHNMANKCKQSASDMYRGTRTSFESASNAARSAMSSMYNGVTTSSGRMASKVIADWNRIRSALSSRIVGTVEIRAVGVERTMSQIASIKSSARSRAVGTERIAEVMTYKARNDASFARSLTMPKNTSNVLTLDLGGKGYEKKEERVKDVNMTIHLNIDNFVNKSDDDIDNLVKVVEEKLLYSLKREKFGF